MGYSSRSPEPLNPFGTERVKLENDPQSPRQQYLYILKPSSDLMFNIMVRDVASIL